MMAILAGRLVSTGLRLLLHFIRHCPVFAAFQGCAVSDNSSRSADRSHRPKTGQQQEKCACWSKFY